MHGRERTNPSHSFGLHRVRIMRPSRLCSAMHSHTVQKKIKVVDNGAPVFSKEVDDALLKFLERERNAGHAVGNRPLSEDALRIASQLQLGNFIRYRSKKTQAAKDAIQECDTDLVSVPAGCTSLLQPADIFWNKPFKASLRKTWEAFLQKEENTVKGNLRKPSRQNVLEFVYEESDLQERVADIDTIVPENPDELRNECVDLIFKTDSEESFDGFDSDQIE
ncbi:hypothetical protein HPB47_002200 [Ixodes persulcatus]|uniref:Uncharacterized protein n=1 Tax=Ixodes persulcatus TaxID=34615 RepID=A0AC60PMS2_IXOPE|nr:hypothetical protein HPB47_002200 [Ixodes persulcatus]